VPSKHESAERRILCSASLRAGLDPKLSATTPKPPENEADKKLEKTEFWCASCHRHRPIALLAAKRDKTRSYCRDCYEKRKAALRSIKPA
jgi:hypothetical protein